MARSKGEGTIVTRKDGMHMGVIELPSHELDKNGKPKRRRKFVYAKTRSELLTKMSKVRKALERSGDIPTASMTVARWFDYWMREIAVKTRRPSTTRSYQSVIDQHVVPAIGTVRLDKLTPVHIRKVISIMDGKNASSTYQRNAHSVMAAAFADAEREGRINRNPVDLVQAPLKAISTLNFLTVEETKKLLEVFRESEDAYLWATFLLTGGRRGEIIGLEWDRVDELIDLSWQMQRIGANQTVPANYERRRITGGLWWTRPKSRAGWRMVPLVQPLRGILNEWRTHAPKNEWGLVFTRVAEDGSRIPLDPDYITRLWPEVLKAAGITRRIRLHDARHTAVDLLYAAGIAEADIKEIVGHSTVEMSRAYRSKQNQERLQMALEQYSRSLGYDA